jgi:hypothetical protein
MIAILIRENKMLFTLYVLFFIHQLTERILHIDLIWIDSFLDPFLCFPLLLPILEYEWKRYYAERGRLSNAELAILAFLFALLFEFAFPKINPDFVFDWVDFLFYGLGYLVYNKLLRFSFLKSIYKTDN